MHIYNVLYIHIKPSHALQARVAVHTKTLDLVDHDPATW